jgi:hypothetical protein
MDIDIPGPSNASVHYICRHAVHSALRRMIVMEPRAATQMNKLRRTIFCV